MVFRDIPGKPRAFFTHVGRKCKKVVSAVVKGKVKTIQPSLLSAGREKEFFLSVKIIARKADKSLTLGDGKYSIRDCNHMKTPPKRGHKKRKIARKVQFSFIVSKVYKIFFRKAPV